MRRSARQTIRASKNLAIQTNAELACSFGLLRLAVKPLGQAGNENFRNELSGKLNRPVLLSPTSALKRITDSSQTSHSLAISLQHDKGSVGVFLHLETAPARVLSARRGRLRERSPKRRGAFARNHITSGSGQLSSFAHCVNFLSIAVQSADATSDMR
jgi:hypothetical protein